MKLNKLILVLLLIILPYINAFIYIVTPVYNHPDYVEIQYKCLKKFLQDKDYKYVVFDDSDNDETEKLIKTVCKRNDIIYYKFPQKKHIGPWPALNYLFNTIGFRSSLRHTEVIRYIFEQIGFNHNDIFVLMDSDLFLFKPFSIRNCVSDYHICSRKFYDAPLAIVPSADCLILNMSKLKNLKSMIFEAGLIGNEFRDTFYFLDHYLYNHKEIKIKWLDIDLTKTLYKKSDNELLNMGYSIEMINFIKKYCKIYDELKLPQDWNSSMFINRAFFNFTTGRDKSNFTEKRINLLKKYVNNLI